MPVTTPKQSHLAAVGHLQAGNDFKEDAQLRPRDRLYLPPQGPLYVPGVPIPVVEGVPTTPEALLLRVVAAAVRGGQQPPVLPRLPRMVFRPAHGGLLLLIALGGEVPKRLVEASILVGKAAAEESLRAEAPLPGGLVPSS